MENIEQTQQQYIEQPETQAKNPLWIWVIVLSIVVLGMIVLSLFLMQKFKGIEDKYETLQTEFNESVSDVNTQMVVSPSPLAINNVSPTEESEKYLIVKEWGLKFEIPEDLTNIKYLIDGDTVYFVAEPADASLSYVANINFLIKNDAMAVLYRKTNSSQEGMEKVIEGKKVGNYYYYTAWSFSGTASGVGVQGTIFGADFDRYNQEDQKIADKANEVFNSLNRMLNTIEVN